MSGIGGGPYVWAAVAGGLILLALVSFVAAERRAGMALAPVRRRRKR
jgi:heme exporter protein D